MLAGAARFRGGPTLPPGVGDSAGAVGDAALCEVVRSQLDRDPITGQDPDIVFAHLAGNMGRHNMAIVQFHAEERVRERLDDRPLHFDAFFFCHLPYYLTTLEFYDLV